MKNKLSLLLLLLALSLQAGNSLVILPYCALELKKWEVAELEKATRNLIFASDDYDKILSAETKQILFNRANFDTCAYFSNPLQSNSFIQVIRSTATDYVLSCAVNYKNNEYGLYYKLINVSSNSIEKAGAYGFDGSFRKLIKSGLQELLYDFLEIVIIRNHSIGFSLSGGYLDHMQDYSAGTRLSYGYQNFGEISIEGNLYTEHLGENIALTYSTPQKYYLYMKFGVGFTSEKNQLFSLTSYFDAPNAEEISKMEHSIGGLAALGFTLPLTGNFRVNLAAEADFIYAQWTYINSKSDEGIIYSYYPELELSYQFRF